MDPYFIKLIGNKTTKNNNKNEPNKKEKIFKINLIKELNDKTSFVKKAVNKFLIFKSINELYTLVCCYHNKSIQIFNLTDIKIISIIKNAHEADIISFNYYQDKIANRDLVI